MAVRTDQRFARFCKTLQMYLMANTIARTREINAVLFCDRTDKAVVVGIFKTGLQGVVVNISDRALCAYAVNTHCLKFKVSHGAGCILCQRLIDFQTDFAAFCKFSVNQMGG